MNDSIRDIENCLLSLSFLKEWIILKKEIRQVVYKLTTYLAPDFEATGAGPQTSECTRKKHI